MPCLACYRQRLSFIILQPAIYPGKDLLKAKLDLLSKTLMIDYAAETYEALHETKNMPEGEL